MKNKVVIPKGMMKAAKESPAGCGSVSCECILEAALEWLSENPIVPTNEQAEELWQHPEPLNDREHYAKAIVRKWQGMMFAPIEPEFPEEVKDLLIEDRPAVYVNVDYINSKVIEAFNRGRNSK